MLEEKIQYQVSKEGVEINGKKLNEMATSVGLEIIKLSNTFLVVDLGAKPNAKGIYSKCRFSSISIFSVMTFLKGVKFGKDNN